MGTKHDGKFMVVAGSPMIPKPIDGIEIDRSIKNVKTKCVPACVK
jgi:hypothetical protein